jgi:predicted N-acetyltransferase YhbS
MLAVDPKQQGQGLATLLVRHIEDIARDAGAQEMRLDCIGKLELPAYYRSLGYEATATVRGHRYGARKSPRTDDRPITRVDMAKRLR